MPSKKSDKTVSRNVDYTAKLNKIDSSDKNHNFLLPSDKKLTKKTIKIPKNLLNYTNKCLVTSIIKDDNELSILTHMKDEIQLANENGTLWTTDWNSKTIPDSILNKSSSESQENKTIPNSNTSNTSASVDSQENKACYDIARDPRPQPMKKYSDLVTMDEKKYNKNIDLSLDTYIKKKTKYRTVTCRYWLKGFCRNHHKCKFAHNFVKNNSNTTHNYDNDSKTKNNARYSTSYNDKFPKSFYDFQYMSRQEQPPIMYHDRPYHGRPYHDRPYHDRPYHDRPYHDRPYDDRPYHDRLYQDRPYHDRPYHDRPYLDRSDNYHTYYKYHPIKYNYHI